MEMLRRHLWVIDLAGIALGAVVSGQAAASLMASALPRPQAPHATPAPPRPKTVVEDVKPAIDGIVGRNIFCSTRGEGPFAAIGLENGDLLLEVNGTPIDTPDAALAAYAKLRTASHVWLAIERNGQRTRMDYDIR